MVMCVSVCELGGGIEVVCCVCMFERLCVCTSCSSRKYT